MRIKSFNYGLYTPGKATIQVLPIEQDGTLFGKGDSGLTMHLLPSSLERLQKIGHIDNWENVDKVDLGQFD